MRNFLSPFLLVFLLIFSTSNAFADLKYLSEQEFRELAVEMAKKVNLFQDVWQQDPAAIFYGGTTRDYLYWLKREFSNLRSREATEKKIQELRKEELIDVRRFIIGDSDVDVVSENKIQLDAATYGIRKFDSLNPSIFDSSSELGKNEIWQGHAPAEKVQLHKDGLSQMPELGDGAHEIYSGKLSVHFGEPEKFQQTKYAKAGENHPILLALRYLRLQAINYYNTYGSGYPDQRLLTNGFDPQSQKEVRKVIELALDGKELSIFLKNHRFHTWLNGTIQKAFRSYTNPTAALQLMKMFGVDQLTRVYSQDSIEPINKYVFSKFRDKSKIAENLKSYQATEAFFPPSAHFFPDTFLYHGTADEAAFRSILFQGILPSTNGSAGAGLYGVAEPNRKFAENWNHATAERVLKFSVKPEAKIVDITTGEGKRVWQEFASKNGKNFETFAEAFGIDILKYPYSTEAFVVKNSDMLKRGVGLTRQLLPLNELLARAAVEKDSEKLFALMDVNQVSAREANMLLQESHIPPLELFNSILTRLRSRTENTASLFLRSKFWQEHEAQFPQEELLSFIENYIRVANKKAKVYFGETKIWKEHSERLEFILNIETNLSVPAENVLQKVMSGELGETKPWLDLIGKIQDTRRNQIVTQFMKLNFSKIMATGTETQKQFMHDLIYLYFGNVFQNDMTGEIATVLETELFAKSGLLVHRILKKSYMRTAEDYLILTNPQFSSKKWEFEASLAATHMSYIDKFLSWNPSREQMNRLKIQSGNIHVAATLATKAAEKAGSPEEMLIALDFPFPAPTNSTLEEMRKVTDQFTEKFAALHPSRKEILEFQKLAGSPQRSLALLGQELAKVTSAQEYLALATPRFAKPSAEYLNALENLHIETLDKFLSLHPTKDEIAQLRKQSLQGKLNAEWARRKALQAGTAEELLEVIKTFLSNPNDKTNLEMYNLSPLLSERLAELKPSKTNVLAYEQFPLDPKSLAPLLNMVLPETKTARDYLELTSPQFAAVEKDFFAVLEAVHLKHLDHFLSLHPSRKEMNELKVQSYNINVILELSRKALPLARTPGDIANAMQIPFDNPDTSLIREMNRLMGEAALQLTKLNPTKDEIIAFKIITHDPKDLLPLLNKVLPEVKTAADYLELTSPQFAQSEKDFSNALYDVHLKHLDFFLSLHPTHEEMNLLKKRDHRYRIIEELSKKVADQAKSAKELIAALGLPSSHPSYELRSAMMNVVGKTIDAFAAFHPSPEEVIAFKRLPLHYEKVVPLIDNVLAKTKTAADFLELSKQEQDYPRTEFGNAMVEIQKKHLDHFISLHPTREQLNQLKMASYNAGFIREISQKAAEKANTAQDLLAALDMPLSSSSYEISRVMGEVATHYVPKLTKFHLSRDELVAFKKLPVDLDKIIPVLNAAVSTMKTAEEYLALTNPKDFLASAREVQDALGELHKQHLDQFLALHPTKEELQKLRLQTKQVEVIVELAKKQSLQAKTVQELFAAWESPYQNYVSGFDKQMGEVIKEFIDKFIALNPSRPEIIAFQDHPNVDTYGKGKVIRAALEKASTAQDFLDLLGPGLRSSSWVDEAEWKKIREDYAEKFTATHPSNKQFNTYFQGFTAKQIKAEYHAHLQTEFKTKLDNKLKKAKTAADFLELLPMYSDEDLASAEEMLREVRSYYVPDFLRLNPGLSETYRLLKRGVNQEGESLLFQSYIQQISSEDEVQTLLALCKNTIHICQEAKHQELLGQRLAVLNFTSRQLANLTGETFSYEIVAPSLQNTLLQTRTPKDFFQQIETAFPKTYIKPEKRITQLLADPTIESHFKSLKPGSWGFARYELVKKQGSTYISTVTNAAKSCVFFFSKK